MSFRKTTLYQIRAYRAFGAPTPEAAEALRHARHQMIDPKKPSEFDNFIRSIQSRSNPDRRRAGLEIYARSQTPSKRTAAARKWLGYPPNRHQNNCYDRAQNEKYLWHTTRDIQLKADLTLKSGAQVFYAGPNHLFTVGSTGTEFHSKYVKRIRKC